MDTGNYRDRKPILELDGLRGLAILAVMAYHFAGFTAFNRPDAIVNALSVVLESGRKAIFGPQGVLSIWPRLNGRRVSGRPHVGSDFLTGEGT